MKSLTQSRLKELLTLDEETGVFYWLKPTSFRVKRADIAGSFNKRLGRWMIRIDGKRYYRYRLAYFYLHGTVPKGLDHRDRDPSNDRPGNLRPATQAQNMRNVGPLPRKTALPRGVYLLKGNLKNPFRAQIKLNGRYKHLGYFATAEEARAAYVEEDVKQHGEFSPAYEVERDEVTDVKLLVSKKQDPGLFEKHPKASAYPWVFDSNNAAEPAML